MGLFPFPMPGRRFHTPRIIFVHFGYVGFSCSYCRFAVDFPARSGGGVEDPESAYCLEYSFVRSSDETCSCGRVAGTSFLFNDSARGHWLVYVLPHFFAGSTVSSS